MAQKSKLSEADLHDLVPKLDQFVSSLNPSQQTALSRPFAEMAKGQTPQKSIQDFLDQKAGNVNSNTRSIVMGIVHGGGGGPAAGIVGGPGGRGAAAGIVGGKGRGAAAGIVGGPGGRGAAAGIVGGKGRGATGGIVGGPGGGKAAPKASSKPKKKTK